MTRIREEVGENFGVALLFCFLSLYCIVIVSLNEINGELLGKIVGPPTKPIHCGLPV